VLLFIGAVCHFGGGGEAEEGAFTKLTSREINEKYLKGEQIELIREFFGTGLRGIAARKANFAIPPGLTRQSLEAYAEIARRAIANAKGNELLLEVQGERLELIRRALEQLK
jgi:hypothetical protein